MSLNTANVPDGRGVLIFNGEVILLFTSKVKMSFENFSQSAFKGKKNGSLYLTTHRIIFMNDGNQKEELRSVALPFNCLRDVKLEQPLLAPNYLKGSLEPLPDKTIEGVIDWKLSFPKGGCIEFGQALLRATALVSSARPFSAPPMYSPPSGPYYAAPPCYQPQYNNFQAPTHVFPEQPPANMVYMYEAPPAYAGIAPTNVYPTGQLQYAGTVPPPPGFIPQTQQQQYPSYPQSVPPYPQQPAPQYQQNAPPYPQQGVPPYPQQGIPPYAQQGQSVYPQQVAPQYNQQPYSQQPPYNPQAPQSSVPPAYTPYQEAPPLPEKH